MHIREKLAWGAAAALALYVVASIATEVLGGPLDPPGPPGSTYKSLGIIPPSWMRVLPADDTGDACNSARFVCVMGGEAVLDNETGLVWQRTPESGLSDWPGAMTTCEGSVATGDRTGWRLPSHPELLSLLEAPALGALPAGHPFDVVSGSEYWTATTYPGISSAAHTVQIPPATSRGRAKDGSQGVFKVWCVRGGGGFEGQ